MSTLYRRGQRLILKVRARVAEGLRLVEEAKQTSPPGNLPVACNDP